MAEHKGMREIFSRVELRLHWKEFAALTRALLTMAQLGALSLGDFGPIEVQKTSATGL